MPNFVDPFPSFSLVAEERREAAPERELARERAEHFGLGIILAPGRLAGDDTGAHEAHDIVDMSVGVVREESLINPQHLLHAQRGLETVTHLGLAEPRIAVGIEQALARRDQRTIAVELKRPTLGDEIDPAFASLRQAGHLAADGIIAGQVVLAAPAI